MYHFKSSREVILELQSGNAQFGSKLVFSFVPRDLEIWWMTVKNIRAPLLYNIKLCATLQSHGWIQTGVTVWKRSIWVKIGTFLARVTLKFDRWPRKTTGHLSYAASISEHHSIATIEINVEFQSGNAQSGSKSASFCHLWPWNLTDDLEKTIGHLSYAVSSFMHHFIAIGQFKLELQSGNAQFGSKSTIFLAVWPWNLMDNFDNRAPTPS